MFSASQLYNFTYLFINEQEFNKGLPCVMNSRNSEIAKIWLQALRIFCREDIQKS